MGTVYLTAGRDEHHPLHAHSEMLGAGLTALGLIALLVHLVIDLAIVAYAYAVVQRRNLIAEREMKVQMLYPERVASLDAERRRRVNA